jgi:hypothetical protein
LGQVMTGICFLEKKYICTSTRARLFLFPMLPLFPYLLLLPNPFPPFLLHLLPDVPLCPDALPFSLS